MNADRWRQIEQLYDSVRERDAGDRGRFLEQVCEGDEELRREVESLLSYETESAMLLDRPAIEIAARALAADRRSRMINRTLGHYKIESWLGAGGMGEVYCATDTRLDRAVAVKVLSEHLSEHPEALARFETEAKAAAALSHPRILAIHDFGEEDGIAYAVTELLKGETLRVRMTRSPLDEEESIQIAIAVAEGLAAAHSKGITHRDLKPENIFLTDDGRIKILDFGLAQIEPVVAREPETLSTTTDTGSVVGTVAYMSPEQADGRKVDPRSDVFSFGSLLFEMIAGERAFQGRTRLEILDAIRNQEPRGLEKLSGSRLLSVVTRCLRKSPDERFPSAAELLLELRKTPGKPPAHRRRKVVLAAALALALATAGIAISLSQKWHSASHPLTSLAVLPLHNISSDPEQEYFADGMTEVLIADLAQISSLRVISRTSVMQFKGAKKSLPEIARELKVEGIIEGSIQRSGKQVRITAQLVDAATDRHIWGKTYEGPVGDVLTLQAQVARAIAGEIQARLTPQESGRLSRDHPVDPAALEAYLKGRSYWERFTEDSLMRSIENYEQATKIDSSYAVAYAGMSEAWTGLGWIGARPWQEVRPMAKDSAVKALAIDAGSSEAHAAMAVFSLRDWKWKMAEEEDKRAIALNPSYATAHMSYGNILRYLGRAEESIAEAKRAVELDPLAVLTNQVLGEAYLSARRYDLAIAHCQAALEVHPEESSLLQILGWAYVYTGMYQKGAETIARSNAIDGIPPEMSPDLAYVNAVTGKRTEARRTLRLLQNLGKDIDAGLTALISAGLGERKEALTMLEESYARHSSMMTWLKVDARFDAIRPDPAFQDLMRRVGLI